jgi:PKD repeat protein
VRFYEWDFGNGDSTVTTGQTVSYRYSATGNYTVRVRVVTTTGQEGFGQAQIRVTN